MFVMIDAIDEMFSNIECLWEKLDLVSFYFLPLEELSLTDEIYIKMNSRGKPLTDFEHFKAEFLKEIRNIEVVDSNETGESIANRIGRKIDIEWTDLLWNYRDKSNLIDDEFLRAFRIVCHLITYQEDRSFNEDISKLDDFQLIKEFFTGENASRNLKYLEEFFDCWVNLNNSIPKGEYNNGIEAFFNDYLSVKHEEGKSIPFSLDPDDIDQLKIGLKSYPNLRNPNVLQWLTTLFAFLTYIQNRDKISKADFRRRLRIILNLQVNSNNEVVDTPKGDAGNRMPAILLQVKRILLDGIMEKNMVIDGKERPTFNVAQLTEEAEKLDFTTANPDQAEPLFTLEDHELLEGRTIVVGYQNTHLYQKFSDLFRNCSRDAIDCAMLAVADYSQRCSLICGDVGFGKTEIAIRAAFKAAVDGKQTAVLVPTTVLAYQHYNTFRERLKELPVRVDYISRARTTKQVREIIKDLADGKIDILIGTHKLIGKEVKFKDLGLLIVDEEQKFGVAVKEKLKQMKINVDTLTMSATPIPRTLQFSLMGARDLTSLNTPPANRYPIITSVSAGSDDIIAEAVNFELSRNGQVFMINNRIEGLYELEAQVKRLVPDARTIVAHGQMSPEKLEKAIIDFANHDYDVLIATTIIESGIDMPNVNTIIVNNAQNFGLSELHQLRGRVGRSNRKAFCYLLVPPHIPLSPVARRRLQAIESFSDLGSGIHIAMQDLDIRGAGNLLGAEQSGFIADLGYETYQKILKEAVTELRTEEFSDLEQADRLGDEDTTDYVADCVIESDMELLLPADYVPTESERISLYQELDGIERELDLQAFKSRLTDRFGAIPPVTAELLRIPRLRRLARRLGIEKVALKQGKMFTYFVDENNKAYYQSEMFGKMLNYLTTNPRRVQIREKNGKRSFAISNVDTVETAVDILQQIIG